MKPCRPGADGSFSVRGEVVGKTRDGKNGNHGSDGKAIFHNTHASHDSPSLILPPRGDYQTLPSYQKTEVIYQKVISEL